MKMGVLGSSILLACLLGCAMAIVYDEFIDLSTGSISGSNPWITLVNGISGAGSCNKRGVLKLNFNSAGLFRRKVRIDMTFSKSVGYTFDIGDSRTNDGWGMDSGTQSRDAEVHSYDQRLHVFGKNPPTFHHVNRQVVAKDTNKLQFVIKDGVITYHDGGSNFDVIARSDLFALKGQGDFQGPINYSIYVGMNRVIKLFSPRTGSGLCTVGIKWLNDFP